MKEILLILVFMISSVWIKAQILNVDRVVNDSMSKPWYIMFSSSLSFDKQRYNITDMSSYLECLNEYKNNYGIISIIQYDATLSSGSFIQDEGFLQIRYRDVDTRINSIEGFVQHQWNGMWGLERRNVVGANFRRRLFVNKNADGYLGIGSFYQDENWNFSAVDNLPDTMKSFEKRYNRGLRTNFYLKIAKKIFRNFDIVSENMVQTNMIDMPANASVRWYSMLALVYDLSNKFQLRINYDHMYNEKPIVPIKQLYYGYKITFNIIF